MVKKKTAVAMVTVAYLDADSIYQGVKSIPETELTDDHVQVPADCDLAPGAYEWEPSRKTFLPVETIFKQLRKKPRAIRRG